jgi:hypothetical protein
MCAKQPFLHLTGKGDNCGKQNGELSDLEVGKGQRYYLVQRKETVMVV